MGSIPGRVIPKTLKMVLDASLLNTSQYKVRIKSKVEQSRERSNAPPTHLGVVAIEKPSGRPRLREITLLIHEFRVTFLSHDKAANYPQKRK